MMNNSGYSQGAKYFVIYTVAYLFVHEQNLTDIVSLNTCISYVIPLEKYCVVKLAF